MDADFDQLKEWLTLQLSIERVTLEAAHASLLDEFNQKLQEINVPGEECTDPPPKQALDDSTILPVAADGNAISASSSSPDKPGRGGSFISGEEIVHGNAIQRLVKSKEFELFFFSAIIGNVVVMVMEAQYAGLGLGYTLEYPKYTRPKEEVWAKANDVFFILDHGFAGLYILEILCKLVAEHLFFFVDPFNIFDVVIVSLWCLEAFLFDMPVNTMLFRLLRLARLAHLVKVIHSLAHVEELFLMLTALKGCMRMLFWACLVLCSLLLSLALLLNQVLTTYVMADADVSIEIKRKCFEYFGTFSRSMFSMFELALANWIPVSRFLIEDVHESFVVFTLCYKLCFGFAVISVINGCFIKETFKIAEHDDYLMVLQKEGERRVHHQKMMRLLGAADTDGDGEINKEEFVAICGQPDVNKWLGAMGLRASDSEGLFDLMDPDGDGTVEPEELVAGTNRLRGPARSLDLAHLSQVNGKREKEILKKIDEVTLKLEGNQANMRANQLVTHDNQSSLKAEVVGMQVLLSQLTKAITNRLPPPPIAVQAPISPGQVARSAASKR